MILHLRAEALGRFRGRISAMLRRYSRCLIFSYIIISAIALPFHARRNTRWSLAAAGAYQYRRAEQEMPGRTSLAGRRHIVKGE